MHVKQEALYALGVGIDDVTHVSGDSQNHRF